MPRGHYLTEAVKDAIWVLRGGGERGRDQPPARYAEADSEQVPAADGRDPAESTPSTGAVPDFG